MSIIYLVQGDTGPQVKITVTRESTGSAIDVSGGSAALKVRKKGSETVVFTLAASTVENDLAQGILIFVPNSSELATIAAGNYEAEVEITLSDGTVETIYETIPVVIREDF